MDKVVKEVEKKDAVPDKSNQSGWKSLFRIFKGSPEPQYLVRSQSDLANITAEEKKVEPSPATSIDLESANAQVNLKHSFGALQHPLFSHCVLFNPNPAVFGLKRTQ